MTAAAKDARVDVLFLSTSVGAGHDSAARALMVGLAQAAPELRSEFLDSLSFVPRAFLAVYAGGYHLAMARLPRLWGLGYVLADLPQSQRRGPVERCRLRLEGRMLRKLASGLQRMRPRLIVHTHFLALPFCGRLIETGRLAAPQFVVTTDCQLHRFWFGGRVERWFVASAEALETLQRWGIAGHRICHSGIPVHPKWLAPLDRAKLLAAWDFPAEKQIVILAGGAQFTTGPVAELARHIAAASPQAFVVVLAGHNKSLLAQLASIGAPRIRGVPMTDRAQELVELSTLMITKAGGISTAECAAKGKPMVFLRPVPGQEAGNARHYCRPGAAVVTRKWSEVAETVRVLLADEQRLARMAHSAAQIYRPATETIVSAIRQALT